MPPKTALPNDLLGAHVSTAGGPQTAWQRGVDIGATAIQLFTKTPNQWREPTITDEVAARSGGRAGSRRARRTTRT